MAKYRSYNEELLIAQILLGNIFNDIVIDRRKHGLSRDYSKPIRIQDIVQKDIQIPCIFGDIGTILRSLENETGTIKLPLFILQSGGVKSDMSRNCDIHSDIFYQQDEAFFDLQVYDPLYKRFDQKLDKQRGLPITIDYTLTLVTKYKEDLDQMMTNWMVHCRPDLYVKWWHPRNRTYPLESEILWGQNINYEAPSDVEPTTRFQYKATTDFTFKTWVFPGTIQQFDPNKEKLIEYFNYVNITQDDNIDTEYQVMGDIIINEQVTPDLPDNNQQIPENDNSENISQSPVTRKTLHAGTAGYYVVDWNQQFENDGSDPEGIKQGKYFVNNVEEKTKTIVYDAKTKQILSGQDIIEEMVNVGDMSILNASNYYDNHPKYMSYASLLETDPIENDVFGFKYVYFKNGFPYESMIDNQLSGDLLLKHFFSERSLTRDKQEPLNKTISSEFGFTYTDPLTPNFDYNVDTKELTIWGQMNNYPHYVSTIKSIITSSAGIKQEINLKAIPINNKYPIEIGFKRGLTETFLDDSAYFQNILTNVALWNNDKTKWFEQSKEFGIGFEIESDTTKRKLNTIKNLFTINWDNFELTPVDNSENIYELKNINSEFLRNMKACLNIKNKYDFIRFNVRNVISNRKYKIFNFN